MQKWVIKWEIIFFVKRALSFMIRIAPVYNVKQLYLIQWCETFQPLLEHLVSLHNASVCIYVRVCVLVSKIKALQPGQWVHVLLTVSPENPRNVKTCWQSLQSAALSDTERRSTNGDHGSVHLMQPGYKHGQSAVSVIADHSLTQLSQTSA